MYLFKECLSLIIKGVSSNFNKYFMIIVLNKLKLSKDDEFL